MDISKTWEDLNFNQMSSSLCIDFGNTRKKCAVFENKKISEIVDLDDNHEIIKRLISDYRIQKSILSSVIDHDVELENLLKANTRFHKLSHLSKLPFTTPVGKPGTIGADRLALAAAAVFFYGEKSSLVIALGSCITVNFITKSKEFIGGSISPGMEMRFSALHTFTAKLPNVVPDWNFPLVGYDTRTNILSGVILGMSKEIDGIIELYKERYSNFNVLLTGGDSPYFARHLKSQIFADPELIFKGLYAISEFNDDDAKM